MKPLNELTEKDMNEMSQGVVRIAEERARQIAIEGWTPEHDDAHDLCEMVEGARCYLSAAFLAVMGRHWAGEPPPLWPWNQSWWKPSDDPIRNLEKAGALIAAEIDRLIRLRALEPDDYDRDAAKEQLATARAALFRLTSFAHTHGQFWRRDGVMEQVSEEFCVPCIAQRALDEAKP